LTQTDASDGLAVLVTGSVVFSLGIGPLFVLTTDLIMGSAPPERAGAASAISETGAELGGAMGIAILGSIGAAVYRGRMGDAIVDGIPAAAGDTARDTLGGAIAVAQQLPDRLGGELVSAAHSAFTQGLHITTAVGAVIAIGMAGLVLTMLRDARTGAEPEAETEAASASTSRLEPACAEC
jgi:DHA2 family multidrug resistance protein-like MFS transporter